MEGRAAVDCGCDAEETEVVDGLKDSDRELVLPDDDAGVERLLKPVKPDDGADALAVVVLVDAACPVPVAVGKVNPVKPELAPLTAGAEGAALVVVVVVAAVVTAENREDCVVPNAAGFA